MHLTNVKWKEKEGSVITIKNGGKPEILGKRNLSSFAWIADYW